MVQIERPFPTRDQLQDADLDQHVPKETFEQGQKRRDAERQIEREAEQSPLTK